MNKRTQKIKYIVFDYFGSLLAWVIFFSYRKIYVEPQLFEEQIRIEFDDRFLLGVLLIPIFWVSLYYLNGFYNDVFRKSRLKELGNSLWINFVGAVIIFFILLLDDYVATYRNYYHLFLAIFALQFFLTYPIRLIVTTSTIHKIHRRRFGFPTIIIGDDEKALELYNDLQQEKKSQGNIIIGYVSTGFRTKHSLDGVVPHLGELKDIRSTIRQKRVEEVLIALETCDNRLITKLINDLLGDNLIVKAIPSLYDYLTGRVKMTSIFGTPLIQLSFELMPNWQVNVKQFMDTFFSAIAILTLLPVMVAIAIVIKVTSKGPIFHRQERIGRYGKPFTLYKFRSMFVDAEAGGPALSSKNDTRITKIGRFMRKTRLDEIPNFYNVLKGEMSLVGPRPERQFFIDQIVTKAPHYLHLQKVKPGITSWGQVKFGYAENVDEMVQRLKYDVLYLENMSIFVDLKIIIYTLITVFRGRGV